MRLAVVLSLLVASLFQASCVSSKIAESGKKYGHLCTSSAHQDSFDREFGAPIYSTCYSPPTAIENTPEYKASDDRIHLDDRKHTAVSKLCVYRHIGPFHRTERGQAPLMTSGMTFGLAEPWMIAEALKYQKSAADQPSFLSVWFTPDGGYASSVEQNLSP